MFNATRNLATKYGSKLATVGALVTLPGLSFAQAASTDPVADIFAGINLAGVVAAVIAIGLVVMSIVMAFKGIDLGKRAVSKA